MKNISLIIKPLIVKSNIYFIILLTSCNLTSVYAKVYVQPSIEQAANTLISAKEGQIIILPRGNIYLNQTLHLPSDVTIIGYPEETILYLDESIKMFFRCENKSNIKLRNFIIKLKAGQRGVYCKKVSRVLVDRVNIYGNNLDSKTDSGMALYFGLSNDIKVTNNYIENTRGGIYIVNKSRSALVQGNILNRVNFGNIVFTGSGAVIDSNKISEGGKASFSSHGSGDMITIGFDSSSILISNNYSENDYCYHIWAHGRVEDLTIENNVFKSGVTTAINIENPINLRIRNNIFQNNLAHGIYIYDKYENVSIQDNYFYDDEILLSYHLEGQITITGNTFVNSLKKNGNQANILGRYKRINVDIDFPDNIFTPIKAYNYTSPYLEVDGKRVNKSFRWPIYKRSIKLTLVNPNNTHISLAGFPQVFLTTELNVDWNRGPRNSGYSTANGYEILASDQPNKLVVEPHSTISFEVRFKSKGSGLAYLYVPILGLSSGDLIKDNITIKLTLI